MKWRERRASVSVSRSAKLPDIAYIMMPAEMASAKRVNISHNGGTRLALDFDQAGDFVVRQTSARSYTVRITIPKRLAHVVPIGLNEVKTKLTEYGRLVIELQTEA